MGIRLGMWNQAHPDYAEKKPRSTHDWRRCNIWTSRTTRATMARLLETISETKDDITLTFRQTTPISSFQGGSTVSTCGMSDCSRHRPRDISHLAAIITAIAKREIGDAVEPDAAGKNSAAALGRLREMRRGEARSEPCGRAAKRGRLEGRSSQILKARSLSEISLFLWRPGRESDLLAYEQTFCRGRSINRRRRRRARKTSWGRPTWRVVLALVVGIWIFVRSTEPMGARADSLVRSDDDDGAVADLLATGSTRRAGSPRRRANGSTS